MPCGILTPCCVCRVGKFRGCRFAAVVVQLVGIILFVVGAGVPCATFVEG